MKKPFKKKTKGIAERKTETKRTKDLPYKGIGLGILLWLIVTWLFFGMGNVHAPSLSTGQTVPLAITASVDFECENLEETDRMKELAADQVLPVFSIDPLPAENAAHFVRELFSLMEQHSTATTNNLQAVVSKLEDLLKNSKVTIPELMKSIPPEDFASTRAILLKGIREVMPRGILADVTRVNIFSGQEECQLLAQTESEPIRKTVKVGNLYTTRTAVWTIRDAVRNKAQRELLDRLLPAVVTGNMVYEKAATEEAREIAINNVKTVYKTVSAGTILARAGDKVNEQTALLLQRHTEQRIENQDALEQALGIISNSILLLAGLIATIVILRVVSPHIIRQPDKLLLLVILSFFTIGSARLFIYLAGLNTSVLAMLNYLVPHALAVLLAGILLGGSAAVCLGFWCSFATAVLFDQSLTVFTLGMVITITATSTVRNIHRRANLFRAGLWVCAVKVLFVLIEAIVDRPDMPVLMRQTMAAVLSGMLATTLALLLIPLFEKIFKITTDITLLELSDMGHPLLQKMAIQAPGTYHHSLMVATLAQNAAEAIGANSLLVRVCAYYHDIGKMAKPEFFTENIQHKENPHDELSPHMSALVISSHVKEGLTLARRHKLPPPILDAIEQHHGNGLISFFYHKAKTLQGDGETSMADLINDSDFRYGGAPAVSREMAILSLADASEAASRSIEKPTPQKISNLMDDIFAGKIRDGQMDHANLTMAEINAVKQSFIFSLSNMLHGRIPYPKDHDNKHSKPAGKTSGKSGPTAKAD